MKYTLKDLVQIKYGKNQKAVESDDGCYPIYGTGGLMAMANSYLYDKPSVLIGRKGTIDKVRYVEEPFWTVDTLFYTIVNEDLVLPRYLYYKLSKIGLGKYNEGTTIPSLRTETLYNIAIEIPSIDRQKDIIDKILPIEQKIEINNRINNNLEDYCSFLSEKYSEDTNSKLKLSEFFEVKTGKKDANASSIGGVYPFFTCSKEISLIDEYTFDCNAIILAGNGDFNVKFYRGKFDAYQRTYVLEPKNPALLGYLYIAIKNNLDKITCSSRGSVIKFLTKGMIENYEIPYGELTNDLISINNATILIEKIKAENLSLKKIRDSLINKLIN